MTTARTGKIHSNNLIKSVVIMFSSSERKEDKNKYLAYDFVKGYVVKGKYTPEEVSKKITPFLAVK